MTRINRPDTAFSVSPTKGRKRPRVHDNAHLAFIRVLNCCICGKPNPDAAHIRSANPLYGKRETGMGEKASDRWTVPLCREHHNQQHNENEPAFWKMRRIDPFPLALALHHASGDLEIADMIIRSHNRRAAAGGSEGVSLRGKPT